MYITGLGTLGPFGRGTDALISESKRLPNTSSLTNKYSIDNNILKDKILILVQGLNHPMPL